MSGRGVEGLDSPTHHCGPAKVTGVGPRALNLTMAVVNLSSGRASLGLPALQDGKQAVVNTKIRAMRTQRTFSAHVARFRCPVSVVCLCHNCEGVSGCATESLSLFHGIME